MNEYNVQRARLAREQFFERKTIDSNGCWVWTGPKKEKGYGWCKRNGRIKKAHRVAWEYVNGPIPEGKIICHRCDNPPCINPEHLYAGTFATNYRDMVERGRRKSPTSGRGRGVDFSTTYRRKDPRGRQRKLDESQISEVRRRRKNGEKIKSLALEFGVSESCIWNYC